MDPILVIDDDVELCSLVGEYLDAEGFRVESEHVLVKHSVIMHVHVLEGLRDGKCSEQRDRKHAADKFCGS